MQKIERYNEAARAAVEELKPLLADAIQEAREALDENQGKISGEGQRAALLKILKAYTPTTDDAESVLNSYISGFVRPDLVQDGRYILSAYDDVLRQNVLKGEAARKAANALLAAQAGLIPSGLTVWPGLDAWSEKMWHKQLYVWVAHLMPEEAQKFERKMEKMTRASEDLESRFSRLNDIRLSSLAAG